uniref:PBPe domain-containing protein n=1 Tax=Macrostomum lignano TaxID=282301 RepID=A0A1I8HNV3_9PLAT
IHPAEFAFVGDDHPSRLLSAVVALLKSHSASLVSVFYDSHQDESQMQSLQSQLSASGIAAVSFQTDAPTSNISRILADSIKKKIRFNLIFARPDAVYSLIRQAVQAEAVQAHYYWLALDEGLRPNQLLRLLPPNVSANVMLVRGSSHGLLDPQRLRLSGGCPDALRAVMGDSCDPGAVSDVLNIVRENLNFSTIVLKPPDGQFGAPINGTQRFSGCIGELQNGGQDFYPFAMSPRTVMVFWWLLTVIIFGAYTGDLTAHLATSVSSLTIRTLEDLVSMPYYTALVPRGTNIHTAIDMATSGPMFQLKSMTVLVQSHEDCARKLLASTNPYTVCIADQKSNLYFANQFCEEMYVADEYFNFYYLAWPVPKDAFYADAMNLIIRRAKENGLVDMLRLKYFPTSSSECSSAQGGISDAEPINLEGIGGSCLVPGVLYLIGLLILLLELFWTACLNKDPLQCSVELRTIDAVLAMTRAVHSVTGGYTSSSSTNASCNGATRAWPDGTLAARALAKVKADLAVVFAVTNLRYAVVDYLDDYLYSSNNILVRIPPPASKIWNVFTPMTLQVWLLLAASIFIVPFIIYLLALFSPFSAWNLKLSFAFADEVWYKEYLWSTIGSFLQQGQDFYPFAMSPRTVMVFWWLL